MKFPFILFILVLMGLISCEPQPPGPETYRFNIKGSLSDTNRIVNLGDTIKFEVTFPTTIIATNEDGESKTVMVNSLQRAFYGFHLFRVDTINHKVYSYTGDSMKIDYFLNPGYQLNPCYPCYGGYAYFQNSSAPYKTVLHMIPRVRGIFFLEIDKQEGSFKINNNFEGVFSVRIDVLNPHLDLVDRHIPGFTSAILQSGKNVFCFQVN